MGVTSSCHPLCLGDRHAPLADRGLFQSIEVSYASRGGDGLVLEAASRRWLQSMLMTALRAPYLASLQPVVKVKFSVVGHRSGCSYCCCARSGPALVAIRNRSRGIELIKRCIAALAQAAISVVGNGLCPSSRILYHLKALLGDDCDDLLFGWRSALVGVVVVWSLTGSAMTCGLRCIS